MGYSRQQFYEIRRCMAHDRSVARCPRASESGQPRSGAGHLSALLGIPHPRLPEELALQGVQVSSGGVRGVWSRHHLLSKHERLLRLEQHTQKQRVQLSDQQIRLLERFSPEFRDRHIQFRPRNTAGTAACPKLFYSKG